jgi:hypothetical protein
VSEIDKAKSYLDIAVACHDHAVASGAKCGPDCMFDKSVREPRSKGIDQARARAYQFLINERRPRSLCLQELPRKPRAVLL